MTRARDVATQGGLTLINETDFPTTSTLDITNVFSSNYKNYKVMFVPFSSVTTTVSIQLLNGSTPATTLYYFGYTGLSSDSGAQNYGGSNTSSLWIMDSITGTQSHMGVDITVMDPFNAIETKFLVQTSSQNGAAYFLRSGGGIQSTKTSYNGIRFIPGAGTINGNVKIYGYN